MGFLPFERLLDLRPLEEVLAGDSSYRAHSLLLSINRNLGFAAYAGKTDVFPTFGNPQSVVGAIPSNTRFRAGNLSAPAYPIGGERNRQHLVPCGMPNHERLIAPRGIRIP